MTYNGWYAIKLNQPTNQPTNYPSVIAIVYIHTPISSV